MKKICTKCKEELDVSKFHKDKSSKDDLVGTCKVCVSTYNKEYRENNKEKEAVRAKEWNLANKERQAKNGKIYRKANKKRKAETNKIWYQDNKESQAEYSKLWQQNNPDKVNAKTARYKASKLQRTVSYANNSKIQALYTKAQRLTNETGILHHVDHIIPLQSPVVSGLHIENNLQVITATENLSKGNKFDLDVFNKTNNLI